MDSKIIDLTGQRFGRLVAIRMVKQTDTEMMLSGNCTHWLCKCDCGNEAIVRGDSLRRGATRSCGCLRRETSSKMMLEYKRRCKA